MIQIYDFTEYRDFLRLHYEERKKEDQFYSYRYIAMKVGFKSSFLSRLYKKETHLAVDKIEPFAKVMNLSAKEELYFDQLVRLGRAKSDSEKDRITTELERLKGVQFRTLQQDEELFFSQCHNMALRSLLGINEYTPKDHRIIGSTMIPTISINEVKESIELLTRLKMVELDKESIYRVTDTYISTKEQWSANAIHNYQKQNIALSQDALENLAKVERDISTVTFTMDISRMEELREKIKTFREDLLRFSEEGCNDDAVMHLNLQLFPVAKIK